MSSTTTAGVRECVRVCAGVRGYARVCVDMRRGVQCGRVCIGVHKCALVCAGVFNRRSMTGVRRSGSPGSAHFFSY